MTSGRHGRLAFLAAVGASALTCGSAPDAAAATADPCPRAFLERLYSHYPVAGKARPFDPLGPRIGEIFDTSLVALIKRDEADAHGEVGRLDGDPLCDCQDDGGMTWKIGDIAPSGRAAARAHVRLIFPEEPKPRIDDLTISLVNTPSGWRIHDIGSADTPSLRGLLRPARRGRR